MTLSATSVAPDSTLNRCSFDSGKSSFRMSPGLDSMRGVDDRHDVLLGRRHVEELLVAEVLHDVGAAGKRADIGARLAQLDVLRPEAGNHLLA